jgi:AAA ATPase-like protein
MSTMPRTEHHPAMNPSKLALTLVAAEVAPASRLPGRRAECARLDRLVADVRAGQSRVLVLRGGPGTGKTALLDYLAGQAAGCRLVRVAGMEPEIEFAFAGLHQLLAPMLDRLEQLPGPRRDALRTVFGLSGARRLSVSWWRWRC